MVGLKHQQVQGDESAGIPRGLRVNDANSSLFQNNDKTLVIVVPGTGYFSSPPRSEFASQPA